MGLTIISVKYGKEIDSLDVGYGGFDLMREQLAPKVGYQYRHGKELFSLMLHYDSKNEKDFLIRFFLHPDCDGKIMQADLKRLYKEFKNIEFGKESDGKNFKRTFDKFLPFLKNTVDQNAHWEFYQEEIAVKEKIILFLMMLVYAIIAFMVLMVLFLFFKNIFMFLTGQISQKEFLVNWFLLGGEQVVDREKIIQLATQLAEDSVNSISEIQEHDEILEELENELYYRPVMPKFFDEWYNSERVKKLEPTLKIIRLCNLHGGGSLAQYDLYNWLHDYKEGKECKWIANQAKYEMCFDAIRNGYEVEK